MIVVHFDDCCCQMPTEGLVYMRLHQSGSLGQMIRETEHAAGGIGETE